MTLINRYQTENGYDLKLVSARLKRLSKIGKRENHLYATQNGI